MTLLFTTHTGDIVHVKETDYTSPFKHIVIPIMTTLPSSPPMFTPTSMELDGTSTFDPLGAPVSPPMFTPTSMTLDGTLTPTLAPLATPSPLTEFPLSTPLSSPPMHLDARSSSPKPIIILTDADRLPASPHMAHLDTPPSSVKSEVQKVRSVPRKTSRKKIHGEENPALWMVYNEYGELVTLEQKSKPIVAEELTITQALRLVYKTYHAEFKDKMRVVLNPLLEGKITHFTVAEDSDPKTDKKYFKDHLSTWMFSPSPDPSLKQTRTLDLSPEEEARHNVPIYSGPPRVLDIGCGDGRWCDRIKKEYPEWIVEGVDDVDRWTNSWEESPLRDFMEPEPTQDDAREDYFCNVHRWQSRPEFTCRNLNQLLSHEVPIPQNLYSLIRGRDVFDRVESYKDFLEDVRHLLQPSGVCEFVEIDPRPRCNYVGRRHSTSEHKSGAETDWTDSIADRFKDPYDAQLATAPGWTDRVAERLKASLRPRDGVPAARIKGWLQGAGFWDVKQVVLRLPIGGTTVSGQRLRDLMIQEIEIENSMPVLAAKLPEVDPNDLNFGNFYLNLHVVTARKPKFPRPGDLLMDGSRQEMTDFHYQKTPGKPGQTKNNVLVGGVSTDGTEKGSGWHRYSSELMAKMVGVAPFTPLKDGSMQDGVFGATESQSE